MKHFVDPKHRTIEPPAEPLNDSPFLAMDELPEDSFGHSSSSHIQTGLGNQNKLIPETRLDTTRETTDVQSAALIDNETVFNAEKITRHKNNGIVQYLVKWAGFPRAEATWEPLENILDNR